MGKSTDILNQKKVNVMKGHTWKEKISVCVYVVVGECFFEQDLSDHNVFWFQCSPAANIYSSDLFTWLTTFNNPKGI